MPLRPLDGFVVGVTADRRWQEQAELLERRGASIVHGPTISTLYLASDDDIRLATLDLVRRPPDYLVATTGIGMRAWMEAAATWGLADALAAALEAARIVARGPKAASAVQAAGLAVWAQPATEQMAAVVARLLEEPLDGCRVALQQYGMEAPEVISRIVAAGAEVVTVPVYRWLVPPDTSAAAALVESACGGQVDAVTFTSAPAVHNLFTIAAENGAADELRQAFNSGRVAAACVGPVCAEGARLEGIEAPLVPQVGRLGLLVRVLCDHFATRRRTYPMAGTEVVVQGSALLVDGSSAELTPRERAVFEALAARPEAVLSRDRLMAGVWGSADTDPHTLEVTVGRLRRRLGAAGSAVETVLGRGYRLHLSEPRVSPS